MISACDSRTVDGSVKPLVYDLDGNVTDDNTLRYTWDGENRLKRVETRTPVENSFRNDFIYDYMGRRVERRGYLYQSGAWVESFLIRYVYDGWNLIQELNSAGGNAGRYVWGPDLSGTLQGAGGIGGLVAWRLSSTTYYYLYDGNGNVGQLINKTTGETAAHYEYDPFGNIAYYTGPMKSSNLFRFSTKYVDGSTGLYNYGYRYYSTTFGRWLSRDPIEEKGGLNLYGFVGNDGVNKWDYLGAVTITYNCCTMEQEQIIKRAVTKAEKLAQQALLKIYAQNSTAANPVVSKKYEKWFGKYSKARTSFVESSFEKISNLISTRNIEVDCGSCSSNAVAYVMTNDGKYKIWMCRDFWSLGQSGFDCQGGAVIHEIAHEVDSRIDDATAGGRGPYGTADAMWLAIHYAWTAVQNADNYEFFSED